MNNEVQVWGIWDERDGCWMFPFAPKWSFDRHELEKLADVPWIRVREMSEYDLAKIPEAAAAVTALLNMRAAKLMVEAASAKWLNAI